MAVGGIKGMIYHQAGKLVGSFVRNAEVEILGKIFGTLSMFTKEPAKSGLRKLADLAKERHPMVMSLSLNTHLTLPTILRV